MVARRRIASLWLSAAVLGACATVPENSGPFDTGPSVVEYIPVRARSEPHARPAGATSPSAPPAMFVRADDDGDSGGSNVRYEPIALDTPRPSSPRLVSAIDDDGARDGAHDHDADPDADANADPDDAPQEDRPAARPATRVKANTPVDDSYYQPRALANGLVVPYPLDHVFRGFGPCVGKRHYHEAIDIGGVGADWGVGTPIHAIARSEVVFIGLGATNPDDFGLPDRRGGEAQRGDRLLPRSARIEPYGDVYFFTRKKGRWRSGNILITRATEGPLAGHTIRYLHVAAIHPDIKIGSVIEAGQEVALMGGTGVQESAPHLHFDIEAPDGHRLDASEVFGLPATATCKGRDDGPERQLAKLHAGSLPAMPPPSDTKKVANVASRTSAVVPEARDATPGVLARSVSVPACGVFTQKEDFSSGRYRAHALTFDAKKGDRFAVELVRKSGGWKPKLVVGGTSKDIKVQWLGTGQAGKRAYAVLDVRKTGPVTLELSAWDKSDPPTSASYQVNVAERCKTKR